MHKLTVGIAVSLILAGCGGGGNGSPNTVSNTSTGSSTTPTPPPSNTTAAKAPSITFSVSRNEINELQISTVTWTVTDATSCNGAESLSGSQPTNSSKQVTYKEGTQIFELTCTGSGGTSTKSVNVKGIQPLFDFAGAWYPANSQSLKEGYDGTIVGSFYNQIKIGSNDRYGIALTGWGYKGWDYKGNEAATIGMALFEPDQTGLLHLATSKYVSDSTTYGGASVIVTDLNKDSYQDIVLVSHNETPIIAKPTIVYFGSSNGNFSKTVSNETMAAHDAKLVSNKILTSVVTGHPRNAYYDISNGRINPILTMNLSYYQNNFLQLGSMSQTIIRNNSGEQVLVTAGGCKLITGNCERSINTFAFDGIDISKQTPQQTITPYLSTIPRLQSVVSMDGKGQTHVYRVWSLDLNNDGNMDVLSAQSMWHQDTNTNPVGLQILINDGNNNLQDQTAKLNFVMDTDQETLDPSPSFIDIDNSGIPTLFFANMAMNTPSKHSNYMLLNDGTGRLYVALHDQFMNLTDRVYSIIRPKGYKFPISNPSVNWQVPKFIVVPQQDGSVNFLAEVKSNFKNTNPETGMQQNIHLFVNVGLNYNPSIDYIESVQISDRNFSKKMRTWAGNDTFTDKNASIGTTIDGGRGFNVVKYSNPSNEYTVTKNINGTYRVTSNTNNIDDTLTRIHNIVFSDKTIILE